MRHEHIQLFRRQIEVVLPNVTVFQVIVSIDDVIIRLNRKSAVEPAGKSPHRKKHRIFLPGRKRTIVNAVRQQLRSLARGVYAHQRMTEQRRRIIHIGIRKQKRHARRTQIPAKFLIFFAFRKFCFRQPLCF